MNFPGRVLLGLNFTFCTVGLITGSLPVWRMFAQVETVNYELHDARGTPIDLRDSLPPTAYLLNMKTYLRVLSRFCEQNRPAAPLVFVDKTRHRTLRIGPENCEITDRAWQ